MQCIKCGKEHDGSLGTGKYCSRSCSNSRIRTNEIKEKISNSLKGQPSKLKKPLTSNICEKCGIEFLSNIRSGRKIHCNSCKRKVNHSLDNPQSLLDLSKRTISKILKRANIGCSICGWNKATCDIHHIVERSSNGSNNSDNLIIICPNCHREIHSNKEYNKSFLFERTIDKVFSNWKDFYNMK